MNKIKNYLCTGDLHGDFSRFKYLDKELYKPEETAIIVLGDAGLNYNLDKHDIERKKFANSFGYTFYLVRGNHEARPQKRYNIDDTFDYDICGPTYTDAYFPNIHYLRDGVCYIINGYRALVIGGAYSVDKEYRLMQGWQWFEDEQLSKEEMNIISKTFKGAEFDIILSHTCPLDWQPTDLFLSSIDQSKVDNSMETWMNEFKDSVTWKNWFWGHYHADRDYGDGRRMFYRDIVNLEDLIHE